MDWDWAFKGAGFGSGVEVLMNFILGDHYIS